MPNKNLVDVIRPLKEQARRRREVPSELGGRQALRSIEAVERIESRILPYLASLQGAVPQLVVHRRFYDGAWRLGVSADLPRLGSARPSVNRLEVDIAMEPQSLVGSVSCHMTVADRDLPTSWTSVEHEGDLAELDAFLEEGCLLFARQLYAALGRHV